jgi:hypothetical protein
MKDFRMHNSKPSNAPFFTLNEEKTRHLAVGFLLVFFFGISFMSIQGKSLTTDEYSHYEYGMLILNGDAAHSTDPLMTKMPISAWNALPGKIAVLLPNGPLKNNLERYITARLMTTLFSMLVGFLVFRWSRELYGFIPALASLVLYVFDPNIIAHSQLTTTDMYAAGTVAFAAYRLWKFSNTRNWQNGLWLAFALGLAQLAKYTSISLYPLSAIALLVNDLFGGNTSGMAGRYLKYAMVAFVVGILAINIGYLFQSTFQPLSSYAFRSELLRSLQSKVDFIVPTPYPYLEGLDYVFHAERTSADYGNIYLMGKISIVEGFKGYYFIATALKTPIATQIVLWVAFFVYIWTGKNRKHFLNSEWYPVWLVVFYGIYFNFFYNAQIGIRYYLVEFPLLYVLAGSLFRNWDGFNAMQKRSIMALGLYLCISVLSYYPNYLAYFNEIVWDRKMAYKYLADSNLDWGQDRHAFEEYLKAHPEVKKIPDHPHPINRTWTFYLRVNELTGVSTAPPDAYAWLMENFEPTGMIAPSYLLWEITPEQMQDLCDRTDYCDGVLPNGKKP